MSGRSLLDPEPDVTFLFLGRLFFYLSIRSKLTSSAPRFEARGKRYEIAKIFQEKKNHLGATHFGGWKEKGGWTSLRTRLGEGGIFFFFLLIREGAFPSPPFLSWNCLSPFLDWGSWKHFRPFFFF
ncbi:hypothetical protein IE53DRAFT_277233 [Violaceomyces palustris]|uniref:Uncharacterized protein n=1 Tax=Violaceomyces palustris TaxID=1673888 RepID=A0ACD0NMH2_9BASI|nr:hypothetical protein IE53DRAFT_277233 [Violaceomyces palustris]